MIVAEPLPDLGDPLPAGATAVQARLAEAAIELFYERGALATTVRDITGACGLTPGALYNHFESKDHLLYLVVRDIHRQVDDQLAVLIAAAGEHPVTPAADHRNPPADARPFRRDHSRRSTAGNLQPDRRGRYRGCHDARRHDHDDVRPYQRVDAGEHWAQRPRSAGSVCRARAPDAHRPVHGLTRNGDLELPGKRDDIA